MKAFPRTGLLCVTIDGLFVVPNLPRLVLESIVYGPSVSDQSETFVSEMPMQWNYASVECLTMEATQDDGSCLLPSADPNFRAHRRNGNSRQTHTSARVCG